MTSPTGGQGFILLAGEGRSVEALGVTIALRALGDQTGGALEAFEVVFPPSVQFPPHVHRQSSEAFYVLDGEITAQIGDRTVTMPAGSFGFAPGGTVHGLDNRGTSPARVLAWQAPAPGMDKFLEELSQLPPGPPDMAKLLPIMQKYDIEPVGSTAS